MLTGNFHNPTTGTTKKNRSSIQLIYKMMYCNKAIVVEEFQKKCFNEFKYLQVKYFIDSVFPK